MSKLDRRGFLQMIGDFFSDREIDPQLVNIIRNKVLCPGTGNLTSQQDIQKIFLIPLVD